MKKEEKKENKQLLSETFSVDLPLRYQFEEAQTSTDRLVIFLHGYMDHGPSLARRVLRRQALGIPWLAPNAPFPVPVRTVDGFREAYSWYFMEADKNQVFISPTVAAKMLLGLLEKLELLNREVVIVGFSQGGFLRLFLRVD